MIFNNLLQDLKSKELLKGSQCDNLRSSFSGLSADVIINHFNNQLREAKGYRHNDEVKKFALTLHFHSPRAFDTLNHALMIAKLHAYGFDRSSLNLTHSYLTHRSHRTKINTSLWKQLLTGVPQDLY